MARKKPHEEHENHERWLVSYADFITLLFAFFVVMYSISSVNEGKYRVLSDSMVSAFRSAQKALEPIQVGEPSKSPASSKLQFKSRPNIVKTPVIKLPRPDPVDGEEREAWIKQFETMGREPVSGNIKRIAEDVAQALSDLVDQGLVTIHSNDLWLEVEIKDSILFGSGSARLQPAAVPVLNQVAEILHDFSNPLRVEGFTDNVPINTLVYPSNWELSAARAASVVRLMANAGIDPERMSALGYGEHRPIASNDTAEGRSMNRRVVLVVLADQEIERLMESRLGEVAARREQGTEPIRDTGAHAVSDAAEPVAATASPPASPRVFAATIPVTTKNAKTALSPVALPRAPNRPVANAGNAAPRPMPSAPRPNASFTTDLLPHLMTRFPVIQFPVAGPPTLLPPPVVTPGIIPPGSAGVTGIESRAPR